MDFKNVLVFESEHQTKVEVKDKAQHLKMIIDQDSESGEVRSLDVLMGVIIKIFVIVFYFFTDE